MPAPKNFSCVIERVHQKKIKSQEEAIIGGHPYHGHFAVEKDGQLEDVLVKMNAPPGLERGCGIRIQDDGVTVPSHGSNRQEEFAQRSKARKINMGSLMDMWREATSHKKDSTVRKGSSGEPVDSKSGPVKQILLSADRPLGRL